MSGRGASDRLLRVVTIVATVVAYAAIVLACWLYIGRDRRRG
jgi:hypothetical protein